MNFQVSDIHRDAFAMDNESIIEVVGSQEPLGYTIYKISREVSNLSSSLLLTIIKHLLKLSI